MTECPLGHEKDNGQPCSECARLWQAAHGGRQEAPPAQKEPVPDYSEWVFITRGVQARGPDVDGEIEINVANRDDSDISLWFSPVAVERLVAVLQREQAGRSAAGAETPAQKENQ